MDPESLCIGCGSENVCSFWDHFLKFISLVHNSSQHERSEMAFQVGMERRKSEVMENLPPNFTDRIPR